MQMHTWNCCSKSAFKSIFFADDSGIEVCCKLPSNLLDERHVLDGICHLHIFGFSTRECHNRMSLGYPMYKCTPNGTTHATSNTFTVHLRCCIVGAARAEHLQLHRCAHFNLAMLDVLYKSQKSLNCLPVFETWIFQMLREFASSAGTQWGNFFIK